jgi:hypothetical protein
MPSPTSMAAADSMDSSVLHLREVWVRGFGCPQRPADLSRMLKVLRKPKQKNPVLGLGNLFTLSKVTL